MERREAVLRLVLNVTLSVYETVDTDEIVEDAMECDMSISLPGGHEVVDIEMLESDIVSGD